MGGPIMVCITTYTINYIIGGINMINRLKALLSKKEEVAPVVPQYVYLYTKATSKASTKRSAWVWSTNPSIYAMHNGIDVLRTRVKVDVSMIDDNTVHGYYLTTNKALQRKLLSMCEVYVPRTKKGAM
jgi:hypothetical protein